MSLLLNPWTWLVAGVLLLAAMFEAYQEGGDAREAVWVKRESANNARAAAAIDAAQVRARAAETKVAAAEADISAAYQRGLKENDDAHTEVLVALHAGTRRLYVGAKCPDGGSSVPGPAAPAIGRDGETRAELSEPAAQWLVGIASEADAVARQLAACQAVIMADRK